MHQITSEISEQHLKSIEEISQKIEQTGNIKPYQLAQQMLRLMSGDSSVLKELPTLTHTLKTGMFGEGNIVLAEETSETSIQESRGLLGLTRENIIDIKTYVKTALSLKTTKEEVTKELGYTEDEPFSKKYPDFSPSSFAAFYTPFHNHALVWNDLETNIKENLMGITNKSDLISCMFDFESAKSAWENVPGIAQGLLALFKEAEASLKLQNEFGNALILQNQVSLKTYNKRTWDDNYASLNQVIIDTASKYMPVLHSKAKELQGDANQVYDLTQNELPHTVLIVGEQAMLSANPVLLDKLEDAAANDPYDKKSLEIFNRYICELRKKAGKFSSELDRIDKGITDNVSIISGNIQQNLKSLGFFAQLNNECKRFEQVLQNHTKLMEDNFILPMQVLQEKLKALDASIEEKTDPAHIIKDFKEFLPSSDEVSDMLSKEAKNREEAKLAEVKILYETFLKSIDTMAEVVSICSQTEKRSHLASELSDLRHKFEEVKKGYLELLKSQRDLNQLLMLYDRLLFFVEAGKEQAESPWTFQSTCKTFLRN